MLTSSESADIPTTFTLRQNYPNPFNPVTQIEFAIPATSEIRLEVFEVLGRSVRVLAEGLYAAGTHSVSFDASDLPSGLYMYRLSSADYMQTRSMQLVKWSEFEKGLFHRIVVSPCKATNHMMYFVRQQIGSIIIIRRKIPESWVDDSAFS